MAEAAKPNRKCLDHQLVLEESVTVPMVIIPEPGTALEEMLVPEYWTHVARRMRVGDEIKVRNPSGQTIAVLDVDVVQPFAAKVSIRWQREIDRAAPVNAKKFDGYEIKFRGRARWSVTRLKDGVILQEDEPSRSHAEIWLENHLRVLAQA